MAGFSIHHPSKPGGWAVVPWASGVALVALAVAWGFTNWIPAELERAAYAGAGGLIVLGAAGILLRNRGAACEGMAIEGGMLRWSAPRSTPPTGEIGLAEISSVRIDTGDRTLSILPHVGKAIAVPEQCVQDLWSMASALASKQPQIEIYVDGNRIAGAPDAHP